MKLLFYIFGIAAVLYGFFFLFGLGNEGAAVVAFVAGASLIFAATTDVVKGPYVLKHSTRRK